MNQHLTVRVAWHQEQWNGTVCRSASNNPFCLDLDRIRRERDDAYEENVGSKQFTDLPIDRLPPCRAESGAFMSPREIPQLRTHPYQQIPKASSTHGALLPTVVKVPAFATLVVPFRWMLRQNQNDLDERVPAPLPPDDESPFPSPWVFAAHRQEAISRLFFDAVQPDESLMFFYTKSGHPLGDHINRLVVAVGSVEGVGPMLRYDTAGRSTYPIWERIVRHSIRPEGSEGFLLPYHAYLEPTGDADEDEHRRQLLSEVVVAPEPAHIGEFSYAGEHAGPDVALSALVRCLDAVRAIRRHGLVAGPWDQREDWLNARIDRVWRQRGAFPGVGGMLEALGCRLGTSFIMELLASGKVGMLDDPWPLVDSMLRGQSETPAQYRSEIAAVGRTYAALSDERRQLLQLLSRFALTSEQALRWWNLKERARAVRHPVTDPELLENPYLIAECDLGDGRDWPVPVGVIDRGLLPDATVAAACPVEGPAAVRSPNDARRVRAALVTVLRRAADDGDSLLAEQEALDRVAKLDLERPIAVSHEWLAGNADQLEDEIEHLKLVVDAERDIATACLQLTEFGDQENRLRSLLLKRAAKPVASLNEDWQNLLRQGRLLKHDEANERHRAALAEKSAALETITTRRLSVLVGRAGTGKTTVLGALLRSPKLARDGVLFLAPTGKARVRITKAAVDADAMTVAQFLYRTGRYDGIRQRPLFEGKEKHHQQKTVVIDECSMMTMDDLLAVLLALDLGHVERLILVGDPNQLPPIGVGRPFADLVARLDAAEEDDPVGGSLARLTVEMRTETEDASDTLRLASWYTREQQPVDADRVLSDLELGSAFNDLEIRFWTTPDELREALGELFVSTLDLASPTDVVGFNASLGLSQQGYVPWENHAGAEKWQLLSPMRAHPYGVRDINRWVQQRFRATELRFARQPWGLSLGDEEIVASDKVILTRNGKTKGWAKGPVEEYLANGEVGVMAFKRNERFLNACFTGRDGQRFAYFRKQFPTGSAGPLELAYALTVHKAQGSDFGKVFVVLPKQSQLMSRELLYTALTRSRDRMVLLLEGTDASFLYDLTKPERSETARRNTNLFSPGIRDEADDVPYAEHLVHRTSRGELVRSKSELAIANHLFNVKLDYQYERELRGTVDPDRLRPDFSFIDDAGDVIIWEHLGMLHRPGYAEGWDWKRRWYARNGFELHRNLFTTSEVGGLDMREVESTAEKVRAALS